MEFDQDGQLKTKTWCDNPDCLHYDDRLGITGQNIAGEGNEHFCSEECKERASEVRARYFQLGLLPPS